MDWDTLGELDEPRLQDYKFSSNEAEELARIIYDRCLLVKDERTVHKASFSYKFNTVPPVSDEHSNAKAVQVLKEEGARHRETFGCLPVLSRSFT